MVRNEDFVYMAGLLDGEGVFVLGKTRRNIHTGIIIRITNEEVIEWCKYNFNGTINSDVDKRAIKKQFYWFLSPRRGLLNFLKNIFPFLIIRKKQAKLMIGYLENHKNRARATEEELELCKEMKYLNSL